VIRIDNRGSGYSRFARTPFILSELADDVRVVLDEVEFDRAVAAEMSMPGMIAQEFAPAHHDRRARDRCDRQSSPSTGTCARPVRSSPPLDLLAPPRCSKILESYVTRLWPIEAGAGFAVCEPAAIAELVAQTVAPSTPRSTPCTICVP
jgi:pimeloyl-ACP methyl ester carboxylesterase